MFASLAAMFAAAIAVAAQRAARGRKGLKLTAWVLLTGATIALTAAVLLALPINAAAEFKNDGGDFRSGLHCRRRRHEYGAFALRVIERRAQRHAYRLH
jgi:hypothetical protein